MKKTGIELIADERKEQIEKHNFDLERDKELNNDEQLAQAAIFVLTQDPLDYPKDWDLWFYDAIRLKGDTLEADIKKLAIAGALIAAEIDRLQALTPQPIGDNFNK